MQLIPVINTIEDVVSWIEDEMNLQSDLSLNILTLDDNWLDQPTISFQWNQMANTAEHCLKVLERILREKSSETYLDLKDQYTQDKIKITEAALSHLVTDSETIQKLQKEISDAHYIVALLTSAKKAIDDRRRSLDGLTSLYTSNYFQNQTDAPALKELGDAKCEEAQLQALSKSDKMKKLLNKRKKV